jgi:N-acetyl-gamma-glutamyl-phosphate reductase
MTRPDPIRVAVVGATGYAGAEAVRLLSAHPEAAITVATSERDAGRPLGEVHPRLADSGLGLIKADVEVLAAEADAALVALPHGASTGLVASLVEKGLKVVDLGADFRFKDSRIYEAWYGRHEAPALLDEAVYGLTEFARAEVGRSKLVANPGCYPTGALMALLPLAAVIKGPVVVDSKSGTTGAGRQAVTEGLFAEVAENIRPYKVFKHRHQPEIAVHLSAAARRELPVAFAPHLLPIARGLLSACYLDLGGRDPGELLEQAYAGEPFVRLLGEGGMPEPAHVRETNMVEIGWSSDSASGRVVVMTAIDNLGKGAAGQAVQNLNLMFGLGETTGLL